MKYYVAWMHGFLDLRDVSAPFASLLTAKKAAAIRALEANENGFRAPDNSSWDGAWFSVHPAGGMVDGPHISKQQAEFSRKKNNSDPQAFLCDCGEDKGFTAKLVAMFGNAGVLLRC
jgi:hypothetical protein